MQEGAELETVGTELTTETLKQKRKLKKQNQPTSDKLKNDCLLNKKTQEKHALSLMIGRRKYFITIHF